jgi:hypothetical protein
MPRAKPPEPLKRRDIRMNDRQWLILRELGGAKWLRDTLEKKASMPKKYYQLKQTPESQPYQ